MKKREGGVMSEECYQPKEILVSVLSIVLAGLPIEVCKTLPMASGDHLRTWFTANMGVLFWLTTFGLMGGALILKPAKTVRWLLRGRRPIEMASNSIALLARVIGIVFVLIALAVLSRLCATLI